MMLSATIAEPYGLKRLLGLVKYIGKMIMFSSVMVFVPGVLALYIDILPKAEPLDIFLVLLAVLTFIYGVLLGVRGYERKIVTAISATGVLVFVFWLEFVGGNSKIEGLTKVFLGYGVLLLAVGWLLDSVFRVEIKLKLEEALFLVGLLWVLIPPIVAVPVALALDIPFIDAWFESVEGMSGTGLTVFTGTPDHTGCLVPTIEELPKPILLWRALIQWVGGIGIVVSSMAVFSRPGLGVILLSQVEGRLERLEPSIRRTSVQMFKFYLFLTAISFLLFKIAGMDTFDSVAHAMTGIATAGFSTKNGSIGEYNSVSIEIAAIIVMIIGASNFYDMYKGIRKPSFILKSPELRALLTLISVGTVIGTYILISQAGEEPVRALRESLFQVVSGATTTGFQSMDLRNAPPAFKFMLTILMLIGGSVFSTAGGIKLIRILVALKALVEELKGLVSPPGALKTYVIGRYKLERPDVIRAFIVIFLFISILNIGLVYTVLRLSPLHSVDNIYFDTVSALTNIGLSTGVSGASLPVDVKLLFMLLSTLGRLEILPIVVLIYKVFIRRR